VSQALTLSFGSIFGALVPYRALTALIHQSSSVYLFPLKLQILLYFARISHFPVYVKCSDSLALHCIMLLMFGEELQL